MSDNKVFVDVNGDRIELTGEALSEHLKTRENYADYLAKKEKEIQDVLEKKQIVLDRLGITSNEAKLLLS